MKKFVYLAGPIAGCSNQEINLWRQKCHAGFSDGVIGISPYRAERENDDSESQKRVMQSNRESWRVRCVVALCCTGGFRRLLLRPHFSANSTRARSLT